MNYECTIRKNLRASATLDQIEITGNSVGQHFGEMCCRARKLSFRGARLDNRSGDAADTTFETWAIAGVNSAGFVKNFFVQVTVS